MPAAIRGRRWQPCPRHALDAAAAYDGAGHILVIGGVNASGVRQSSVFSYDIAGDSWSTIESLPESVEDGAALLGGDGLVYMSGGMTATGASDRLYVFNPASGNWRNGPTMLAAHSDHAIAMDNDGFLFVMGGASTNVVEKIDTQASSQAPIALDDDFTTTEDQAITIDVVANDSDADGDPLVVTSINTSGTSGSVVINANGTLSYTPVADFNGVDSFTYRVSDPGGSLDEAVVTVTVSSDGLGGGGRCGGHGRGHGGFDSGVRSSAQRQLQQRRSRIGGGFGRCGQQSGRRRLAQCRRNRIVRSFRIQSASAFGCRRCRGRYVWLYAGRRNRRRRIGVCVGHDHGSERRTGCQR